MARPKKNVETSTEQEVKNTPQEVQKDLLRKVFENGIGDYPLNDKKEEVELTKELTKLCISYTIADMPYREKDGTIHYQRTLKINDTTEMQKYLESEATNKASE